MKKIILEDLDFEWEQSEMDKALDLWKEGYGVPDIAVKLNRKLDETFLLMMHLSRQGKVKRRKGYFWGGKR